MVHFGGTCRAGEKIVNGLCVCCGATARDPCGRGPEIDFRAGQENILRRLEELNEDTECAMIDAYLASGHKYSISNGIIAAMAALIVNLRSQIEREAKND